MHQTLVPNATIPYISIWLHGERWLQADGMVFHKSVKREVDAQFSGVRE